MTQPNILFLMCDQFRFDCISALGNTRIHTPNLDRLVERGVSYTNAYSTCPVCIPARYTLRTGCEPQRTGCYHNAIPEGSKGQGETMRERCGNYLAQAMGERGYRTFGVGKFHCHPEVYEDLGYDLQIHTEEMWASPEHRQRDGYANFIATEHPEYAFVEQLHGERSNMYYQPQMSPLPAEYTVERYVSDRIVEQICQKEDSRPYFGFASFVGPHPPLAPPIPYNRMYNPDQMENPPYSDIKVDYMDESIPFDAYAIWAEDMSLSHIRALKSRYYGEITYIDHCIGRILDAVEASGEGNNTLICFFADHGDMLGDHHAWQKGCFFEASTRVPFLVSWPDRLKAGEKCDDLVCLTDLFALATSAAGAVERRDGVDFLSGEKREYLAGVYFRPGTLGFKIMIRQDEWKYIYLANGGREQLFHLPSDPNETYNLAESQKHVKEYFHNLAIRHCQQPGLSDALEKDDLLAFPYTVQKPVRIVQLPVDKGVYDFG